MVFNFDYQAGWEIVIRHLQFHFAIGAGVSLSPDVVYLMSEDSHENTTICATLLNPELVLRDVPFVFLFNPLTAGS